MHTVPAFSEHHMEQRYDPPQWASAADLSRSARREVNTPEPRLYEQPKSTLRRPADTSGESDMEADQEEVDDDEQLVRDTIAEMPPRERGERAEWKQRVGWGRREDIRRPRGLR